ncbi:efflux RND transporter permease subunit [Leptospira kmetyi]|uniref:efflux RND transporter permease subunit n=1 Tax=Leptospira kmetyi TaxID=408139 RepID=UPI0010827EDF|nr:efflux RND transporter permease subunit [Leptospira kmetyi]TGK15076.1 efflux RND transporter permease subunit [Leptospira kmetyi]TGK25468.1 efflux RND transporter permease subunit [Leptospira kmetyi]
MNGKEKAFFNFGPVTLGMILLGFILFGFFSFLQNSVSLFSTAEYPALTISVEYPSADAKDIEEIVTIPIEESVSNIGGVESIHSFAERGKTNINVEFQRNLDLQFKSLEIRERVDILSGKFPKEVHKPIIYQYDPDQRPVLIITLKSTKYDLTELRRIADFEIKRFLENLDGVSQIAVSGGRIREILISCDMQRLSGFGLDLMEVQRAIQNYNKPASIGKIENSGREFKVVSSGRLKSINEIRKIPIFLRERNKTIYIEDIAEISFSYRDEESASRINGNENISIYVYKASLGNILKLSKDIRQKLTELKISNVELELIYDQAETIKKTYWNISICFGAGLLLLFLFVYKQNFRKSLESEIISIVQLLIAFFVVQLILFILKIPFDIFILSGIVLGFSIWLMLTNRDIVSSETGRIGQKRKPPLQEFLTLLFMILAATLPPYLIDRNTGLPATKIGITLSSYLAISYLTDYPLIFTLINGKTIDFKTFTTLPIELGNPKTLFFEKFFKSSFIARTTSSLKMRITRFQNLRYYGGMVSFGVPIVYTIILIFGIYRFLNIDKELFYSPESKKIIAYVELPSGTGFDFTNSTTKKIEDRILSVEGVKEVTSKIEPAHSFLLITLNESETGDERFIEKIREGIGNTSPAFCYLSRESDAARFKEITVDILGEDNEKIGEIINVLTPKVMKINGVKEMILRYKPPRDELQVTLDRNKTIEAGLLNDEIGNFLKIAIQGGIVTKFLDENREVDVRVRFSREYRNSQNSLNSFYFKNRIGKYIPLTEVSSTKESKSPIKTYRKNKKRMLSFSLRTSKISHSEILTQLKRIGMNELPVNYQLEIGRELEKILETEDRIYVVLFISIVFIYMILASYFESFIKPWIVIVSLFIPIFFTFLILSFIYNTLTLPIYLGLLLLAPILGFQIIQKIKDGITNEIAIWGKIPFLLLLFLPQIVYSIEGGQFLRELEITLILGYLISHLITFRILIKLQDKLTISKTFNAIHFLHENSTYLFGWIRKHIFKSPTR